jgi:hypothetical protein
VFLADGTYIHHMKRRWHNRNATQGLSIVKDPKWIIFAMWQDFPKTKAARKLRLGTFGCVYLVEEYLASLIVKDFAQANSELKTSNLAAKSFNPGTNPRHSAKLLPINLIIKLTKPIPPFRVLINPNTQTRTGTNKHAKALMINLHLTSLPAQDIRPLLASMHLTHMHPLLARSSIRHHDRTAPSLIPRSISYPPDTSRVVEVVLLEPVCVELPGESEVRESTAAGGTKGLLVAFGIDAIEVAVKDARIAVEAEEDEGVG